MRQNGELQPLLGGELSRGKLASFSSFIHSFLTMGMISFGGTAAQVALLHDKYVGVPNIDDRPVIGEATFIELFALSSALPGPSSTQLVVALGATFGGLPGAIVTFIIWQIPGSLLLTISGLWFHSHLQAPDAVQRITEIADHGIGLIAAAFSLVVVAAVKVTETTCGDSKLLMAICVSSAAVAVLIPPSQATWIFLFLLTLGGTVVVISNHFRVRESIDNYDVAHTFSESSLERWECGIDDKAGIALLAVYIILSTIFAIWQPPNFEGTILKTFWTIGATVFGGGQVVIPWILNEIVETKWLPGAVFLSGFGLIGICPGSMFNISWFLGAALLSLRGAVLASVGLILPGVILILGVLPFWERIRQWSAFRTFLTGVNAAAAGLIIAGVWMLMRRALVGPLAYALAVIAGAMTTSFGVSKPLTILTCGLAGTSLVSAGVGGPYH